MKFLRPTHPGTTTKMTRLRGRCLKGGRLRSTAPFGHWKTQTFIAGLRCHGLTAPFVVDTPMNRRVFETYVEGRCRRPRQSRCPQESGRRGSHPDQRRMAALPAALQRSQLCQAQGASAQRPSEPSTLCGRQLAISAISSLQQNAETTSLPQTMNSSHENPPL